MNVEFSMSALRDLQDVDQNVAGRIIQRIGRLARTYHQITHERLTGEFSHLYKYRIGDYRVLYYERDQETISIEAIQHRREVYKRR